MNNLDLASVPCSECGGRVRRRDISQEFERDGVRVSVSGIRALSCEKCDASYFEPGGAQALSEAVNSLFKVARKNRQHKGKIEAVAKRRSSKVAASV